MPNRVLSMAVRGVGGTVGVVSEYSGYVFELGLSACHCLLWSAGKAALF